MKLEEIYENIAKDLPINRMDLLGESIKNSDLFIKYIRLYSDSKLRVEMMQNKKKDLIAEKRDYYSGNAPADVYREKPFDLRINSEAKLRQYIENDPDIIKFEQTMLIEEQKVEILHATLDHIKSRNYSVKSAIDMTKFEAGA